jgi:23S rRNA pseudouridine1911/1915/1917 synthase
MTEKIHHTFTLSEGLAGTRLDQALTKLLPDYSRTQVQEWIKNQEVQLNGKPTKTRYNVIGGEIVVIDGTIKAQHAWEAQNITLSVIYEDDAILVINKPVGMVIHPAAGNFKSTLLNALLHHAPSLQSLPRAGIIHRLDKDTSGLLVIAKTQAALHHLSLQMKERTITRIYQAIVAGILTSGGKGMAVIETGKPAVSHYRVMERYRAHTRVKVQLETGRTHQIRVHMAHIHYPVLGDQTYSGRLQLPKGATPELVTMLRQFKRQALHAFELGLVHPTTLEPMTWRAPLPDDMKQLIEVLRTDTPAADDYDL